MDADRQHGESTMTRGDRERLLAAGRHVHAALAGSRSDRLTRLFDYLVEKTIAGESPSEQQIAAEAFAEESDASGQDANVRVYVHRLRKVLDTAFDDVDGPRLQIPIGEYRLRIEGDEPAPPPVDAAPVAGSRPRRTRRVSNGQRYRMAAAALALVAAIATGWWLMKAEDAPLAETVAWRSIAESGRPLTVVIGDYYLFGRIDAVTFAPELGPQLVWDRDVPTREELIILQIMDPANAGSVVDYGQQFVSGGTIEALSVLRGAMARLPGAARRPVTIVPASQLTPEMLASHDIVYVGQLSGMGSLLHDPLEMASRFRFDPGFDGLTDAGGKARFQADNMVLTDERIARRDFAYLASVPGPAENRILVVAGLGDAGVKEAASIAANPEKLARLIGEDARPGEGFEALYRVRTIQSVNVGSKLLLNRPLRSGGIWDLSRELPNYRPVEVVPEVSPRP